MTVLYKSHTISKKSLDKLPQSYTDVLPVTLSKTDPVPPKLAGPNKSDCKLVPQAMQTEYRYLNFVLYFFYLSSSSAS